MAWWRSFNDPVLDDLIAEAQRANRNVRTAGLRILEARAQLGIAGSTLYPQVQQVTGDLIRTGQQRAGGPDDSATTMDAGLRISWELDFWGRFRRSIEAADAGYLASIAQYDDLQVLMAAQVASLYSSIRTLEARLRIVNDNVGLAQAQPGNYRAAVQAGGRVRTGCAAGTDAVSGYAGHRAAAQSQPAAGAERAEHAAGQGPGTTARNGCGQRNRFRRQGWASSSTCPPICCAAARMCELLNCNWPRSPP